MTERGLERGAGCIPSLDPVQNAPSWCMQGTSTLHTYHFTTRLRRVHRVVYMALLGKLYSKSDRQVLQLHYYDSMRHHDSAIARRPGVEMMSFILLQPGAISTESSTNRPCALDMCNTARNFTHESNICVIRRLAFLNLGFTDLLIRVLYPAP